MIFQELSRGVAKLPERQYARAYLEKISTKSRACNWSTKREVKIRRLNTSINLHSNTALFRDLFLQLLRKGTGEFQTLHLCENPPHVQANSNFILTLFQCVLAFKYHIPLKLGLFYSAFSIDTWPYLFRVFLAFAYDLRRRNKRQTCVIACKRRRVLDRLDNLNIEVINLSVTKM